MEYRFSLTPRLAALGAFASVALMVLMFALGYQLGRRVPECAASAEPPAERANVDAAAAETAPAPAAPATPAAP